MVEISPFLSNPTTKICHHAGSFVKPLYSYKPEDCVIIILVVCVGFETQF